jgi:hypothetical protein
MNLNADPIDSWLKGADRVQARMLAQHESLGVPSPVAELRDDLLALQTRVRGRVIIRRVLPLGDREAPIRALEDSALATLADVQRMLSGCVERGVGTGFEDAWTTVERGRIGVETARALLFTAQLATPEAGRQSGR